MTAEAQATKNFFQLNGGLNTEYPETGFPDGFTTDEQNYELLPDGTRRRRKGLAAESGQGAAQTVQTFTATQRCQSYVWRNVGGNPNKDIIVYRQGEVLYFATAQETVSAGGWATGTGSGVDMTEFKTAGATTANTDNAPVTFSQGRGRLLVSGQYIRPFYVEYDSTNGYQAKEIKIRIRDFGDIEDGVHQTQKPTGAITDDHRYNLRNRGWRQADMDQYFSDQAEQPAKNMMWQYGYKRVADQSTAASIVAEQDGIHTWDSAKLAAEAFGSASAPRGSLFIRPFDSSFGVGIETTDSEVTISSFSFVDNGSGDWTMTVTTSAAHGIAVGEKFTIDGTSLSYNVQYFAATGWQNTRTYDGTYTAETGTTGSTLVFSWTDAPSNWHSWINQYDAYGTVDKGTALTRSSGSVHTDSTAVVEFHAGRAFYAGMANEEWADTIFFSEVVDAPVKFGRCYQVADPTDKEFNALVPTDGGTIVVPGMGGVIQMVSVRNTLLVFGGEGVWEVSGGQRGVFTADGYAVRKISAAAASSATAVVKIEDSVVYTGPGGIYIVAPNQYTGQLEVTNAIEQNILTLWTATNTAKQERAEAFYDDAQKRLYILLGPDGTNDCYIDTMLIFDAKIGAWYKYTFDDGQTSLGFLTGFALPDVDDPTTNKKVKVIYQASATSVNVADFAQTSFGDVTGLDQQLPYMYTGWDNIGDYQRRRQAPVITVYSKRTETGFTASGDEWLPVNESSTKLTALWDWVKHTDGNTGGDANEATTNKFTATPIQVYRHVRRFTPGSATDLDGYPVVVTRNKLRGRGRVLQLKFEGETDKDSHIMGYTVNYKISNRK